jgi:putative drug exporter of the RND superfamily
MIGLGVGVDYALFIVTRHREHLRAGMTVEEAAGRAIATSGSAVLFAGVTVIIAISGLAIGGMTAITIMGLMAGITVAVMVTLALTLLPALLGFAGRRIDSWRVPGTRGGVAAPGRESIWHRWGRQVSAHTVRYLSAGTLVLALLTAPIFSMRLGMTGNGTNPTSMTTRRAYDLLAEGFGPGFNGPWSCRSSSTGPRSTTSRRSMRRWRPTPVSRRCRRSSPTTSGPPLCCGSSPPRRRRTRPPPI